MNLAGSLLQGLVLLAVAPASGWFIKKMKAASQNRRGPSLVQAYADLGKLFRKNMVISDQASWIFHAMPIVLFCSTVIAAWMIPAIGAEPLFGFLGDLVVFVYFLALGKFFLALAALDTGTTFGGMGSSREMTLGSLAEPAFLLTLFALAYRTQTLSLSGMASRLSAEAPLDGLYFMVPAFGAMLIVAIAESGRIPVDNPSTHLELTMIHEAMVLEYSGPYLALIEWAHQIKQLIFLTLLANFFIPSPALSVASPAAALLAVLIFAAKVLSLALLVGWIEIHCAKLRLFRVPDLLGVAYALAILSMLGQLMMGSWQ
ncbi:MAG: NADH-quinone oxidoreductase subunit H [Candidatus Omnitrophica bacterium]|nr:NADH-quinone oxidoreductase subunit H [Candidatus Omnitrophota bacterium]